MKVLSIEELKKTDGSSYWQVTIPKKDGTPSGSPLVEWAKPTYSIGDELPFEVELMKPAKERWYYKRRDDIVKTPQANVPQPARSPKVASQGNDDWLVVQWMTSQRKYRELATQLECHHIVPGGEAELNKSSKRIDNIVAEWIKADVLMLPKKEEK